MEGTIFSLIPPIVTIALIIITKRLFLSLGVGIVLGALLYNQWHIFDSVSNIFNIGVEVLVGDGKILIFVLLIGILSSLLYLSGGINAFSQWGTKVAKTRAQSQMATIFLGFLHGLMMRLAVYSVELLCAQSLINTTFRIQNYLI